MAGELGRRGFLGAAGLLAGVTACSNPKDAYRPDKPALRLPRGTRPGEERWVLTTCGLCRAGCGLRVRVVDGRAVKVEGHAESPVNRGGVCARGQAGLELLYHPDRIPGPCRRLGSRGAGRWQALSWDDAVAMLAGELAKVHALGEARSVVLLDGEYTGLTHALWARFMAAFGSPNHVGHGCGGRGQLLQAVRSMTGATGGLRYDFEHAGCILLVGTGALTSSPHAMALARAFRQATRPRVLCASPRLPRTATFVDTWLDTVPGSAAVLLLGIAHVLLRDNLVTEAARSALEAAHGFLPSVDDSGHRVAGLRTWLLEDFSTDHVASVTGVPGEAIVRVARLLATERPSVVAVDEELVDPGVAGTALLVNALLGGIQAPGGVLISRREAFAFEPLESAVASSPPLDGRRLQDPADSRLLALPQAIASGKPYPTRVLLQSYSNPIYSKPGGSQWRQAIAAVPFVVSFSPVADESTACADLLLPDPTFFERAEIVCTEHGWGHRQPVVSPVADTLQTGEVIVRVAAALGGSVARAFPWKDLHAATRAGLVGAIDEAPSFTEEIEARAFVERRPDDPAPGVVDLRSMTWTSPAEPPDRVRFPFTLVPFRGTGYAEGGLRHLAWLVELQAGDNPRGQRIEITRDDARRLGLEDGDEVLVESPFAALGAVVQVVTTLHLGTLGLPLGRPEAMELLGGVVDPATGNWLSTGTPAQVRKRE